MFKHRSFINIILFPGLILSLALLLSSELAAFWSSAAVILRLPFNIILGLSFSFLLLWILCSLDLIYIVLLLYFDELYLSEAPRHCQFSSDLAYQTMSSFYLYPWLIIKVCIWNNVTLKSWRSCFIFQLSSNGDEKTDDNLILNPLNVNKRFLDFPVSLLFKFYVILFLLFLDNFSVSFLLFL